MPTIEEDSRRLSHTFSQNPWPRMFEVELPLRDSLGRDDMPGDVPLEGICHTQFGVIGLQSTEMSHVGGGTLVGSLIEGLREEIFWKEKICI